MFPIFTEAELPSTTVVEEATERDTHIHRAFVFDEKTERYIMDNGSPKEADEVTAIKQWLYLMCMTGLDKYAIYQGEPFGTSAENILGDRALPSGYIASELQREIEESCELNPAIEYVDSFEISRDSRKLSIAFAAHLVHGELLEVSYFV